MDAGRELPLNTIFGAFYAKNVIKRDFLGIYIHKKSREESGISKLGTNTLQGLLIIND